MKYLILIYSNPMSRELWARFSPAEQAAGFQDYSALSDDLAASGELVVAEAWSTSPPPSACMSADWADADHGRSLRRSQGAPDGHLPRPVRVAGACRRHCGTHPGGGIWPRRARTDHYLLARPVRPVDSLSDLLGVAAPKAIGVLVRRFGDFAACEDAVQDALLAAATQWPVHGVPEIHRLGGHGRLASSHRTVSGRRGAATAGGVRARARRGRGARHARDRRCTDGAAVVSPPRPHGALASRADVAAVGGLTTAEIARAFLVPEATIAQRVSRAKQRITEAGATFALPPMDMRSARIDAALRVLYPPRGAHRQRRIQALSSRPDG